MNLGIEPFHPDLAIEKELLAYHIYVEAKHFQLTPYESSSTREEQIQHFHHFYLNDPSDQIQVFYASRTIDGEVQFLGELVVREPKPNTPSYEDNKNIFRVTLFVLAKFRRQGVGTELLRALTYLAETRGKTHVIFSVTSDEGQSFSRHFHATHIYDLVQSQLSLDCVDVPVLKSWCMAGRRNNPEIELFWCETIPDDLIEEFVGYYTTTLNQQPLGGIAGSNGRYSVEYYRLFEEEMTKDGQRWTVVLALDSNKAVAGLSQGLYDPAKPQEFHQLLTSVREGKRGLGLAKWLKAELILSAHSTLPSVKEVVTQNSSKNTTILAINAQIGFKEKEKTSLYQVETKKLLELFVNN